LGVERLVGDSPKGLGHIHSSISLPRADKSLCMAYVGWGELGRMTTKRCREVRAMFRVKPRDSTNAMASRSSNFLASIWPASSRDRIWCWIAGVKVPMVGTGGR